MSEQQVLKGMDMFSSVICANPDYKDILSSYPSLVEQIDRIKELDISLPSEFPFDSKISEIKTTVEYDLGHGFVGLNRHRRCIYLKVDDWYIAFKGISFAYDIEEPQKEGSIHPKRITELIEEFAEREHEIPFGMTLSCCQEDYDASLPFCKDYYNQYASIPNVPYPLMILSLKETKSVKSNKELLLNHCLETSRDLLTDFYYPQTLGVYIYAIHSSPVRVGHLVSYSPIEQKLGWLMSNALEIVERMFVLGYVPCKQSSILIKQNSFTFGKNKGLCLSSWNIGLGGTLFDFNSVKPILAYLTEKEARYDIQLSLQWLCKLIVSFERNYFNALLPLGEPRFAAYEMSDYNEAVIFVQQKLYAYYQRKLLDNDSIHPYLKRFFDTEMSRSSMRMF
jgi:hypothetical protein